MVTCSANPDISRGQNNGKFNASTETSNGVIHGWIDSEEHETNDEWFLYSEITESALHGDKKAKESDETAGSGDLGIDIPMRKSLFPFVAPYVIFHSIDCKCPRLSAGIRKHLKWKLSGVIPKIVALTLEKSGFHFVGDSDGWSGTWSHTLGDPGTFKQVKGFQKLNCFPGSKNLGCKDQLWTNVNKMRQRFGEEHFGFVPETFVLPREMRRFQERWRETVGDKWIVKPPASGRGKGIRVIDQWWEVPKWHSVVVQRYIAKPKLINGSKFDLRVYVLVTSIDPLRIYVYNEGLVRFASVKYVDDSTNLHDRFMHLTNTSVNKYSPNYVVNDSVDSCHGNKWSFGTLWAYFARENIDVRIIWSEIKDIVVKTMISGEAEMRKAVKENVTSTYNCYELYGFDVILDENLRPWLLEVNTLPSLNADSVLDTAIKAPLIRNVLNIAGYQLPGNITLFQERRLAKEYRYAQMRQDQRIYSTSLSSEEILKQHEFLKYPVRANYILAILKNLTRDDIRQLIRYEDEITQLERFERIFPTPHTHKYHKFFKIPRYYNLLFDAWEFQASKQRQAGIERLKNFCRQKIHLESTL
ncbi:tubulin monoglutamylase TTLL4-like [Athalia rosae]|uniref:tubulin monoglutamylase TTLL4-like n=1 Tax=Athalia rosae TaxID=37344 RepID=UPI002033D0A7|nr:tubulin monoglutamylase TTLL4-like [Athalia rosae]